MLGVGMIMDVVNGILGNGIGILRDWLESKRKIKEAEVHDYVTIEIDYEKGI